MKQIGHPHSFTSCPMSISPHSATCVLILASFSSIAQEVKQSDPIEIITVTAQKRIQPLQDVPLSISVLSGELLDELNIRDLTALAEITPGIVIQEQAPGLQGYVIRGITSDASTAQSSPRVSVFFNGADVSRSRSSDFSLFDIEQVEVVKGPQATLFGTAASGGAISVASRKPQEGTSSQLQASVGSYASRTIEGFVNSGTSDVQGRFAFSHHQRDSYTDAQATNVNNLGELISRSYRPSLRLTPSDELTLDLVYNYELNENRGTSFLSQLVFPDGIGADANITKLLQQSDFSEATLDTERESQSLNLTTAWKMSDSTNLTAISALRQLDAHESLNELESTSWLLDFTQAPEEQQFSQEFRFSKTGDNFTAIAGVSFIYSESEERADVHVDEAIFLNCTGLLKSAGVQLPCLDIDGNINQVPESLLMGWNAEEPYQYYFANFTENEDWQAYADLTYRPSQSIELTFGLRYMYEQRAVGYASDIEDSSLLTQLFQTPQSLLATVVNTQGDILWFEDNSDAVIPRLNLLYKINDNSNLYATISKGRRSEVLELQATTVSDTDAELVVNQQPAEIVWNYESGLKGSALDKKINYQMSVYYQKYNDFQVSEENELGQLTSVSAGSATNLGTELEVQAKLTEALRAFANASIIDASIDNDSDNGLFAGNQFRLQPENTFSTGLLYSNHLTNQINFSGALSFSYRSETFLDDENTAENQQGDVSLVNVKLGLSSVNEDWSLNLFINNLLDKEYSVASSGTAGTQLTSQGDPMTIGLQLSVSLGN